MISLKSFHRTPSLAELKVSYRRGRPRGHGEEAAPVVNSPIACEEYLRSVWDKNTLDLREEFLVICLTTSLEVIGWVRLTTGGMETTAVDPRLVFAVALQTASAAIIVAHNHPSGSAAPSMQDIVLTQRLAEGAKLLGIRLVDHVILTRDGFRSLHDRSADAG